MKFLKSENKAGFITNHEFLRLLPKAAGEFGPRCQAVVNGKSLEGFVTGLVEGGIEFTTADDLRKQVFRHKEFESVTPA